MVEVAFTALGLCALVAGEVFAVAANTPTVIRASGNTNSMSESP